MASADFSPAPLQVGEVSSSSSLCNETGEPFFLRETEIQVPLNDVAPPKASSTTTGSRPIRDAVSLSVFERLYRREKRPEKLWHDPQRFAAARSLSPKRTMSANAVPLSPCFDRLYKNLKREEACWNDPGKKKRSSSASGREYTIFRSNTDRLEPSSGILLPPVLPQASARKKTGDFWTWVDQQQPNQLLKYDKATTLGRNLGRSLSPIRTHTDPATISTTTPSLYRRLYENQKRPEPIWKDPWLQMNKVSPYQRSLSPLRSISTPWKQTTLSQQKYSMTSEHQNKESQIATSTTMRSARKATPFNNTSSTAQNDTTCTTTSTTVPTTAGGLSKRLSRSTSTKQTVNSVPFSPIALSNTASIPAGSSIISITDLEDKYHHLLLARLQSKSKSPLSQPQYHKIRKQPAKSSYFCTASARSLSPEIMKNVIQEKKTGAQLVAKPDKHKRVPNTKQLQQNQASTRNARSLSPLRITTSVSSPLSRLRREILELSQLAERLSGNDEALSSINKNNGTEEDNEEDDYDMDTKLADTTTMTNSLFMKNNSLALPFLRQISSLQTEEKKLGQILLDSPNKRLGESDFSCDENANPMAGIIRSRESITTKNSLVKEISDNCDKMVDTTCTRSVQGSRAEPSVRTRMEMQMDNNLTSNRVAYSGSGNSSNGVGGRDNAAENIGDVPARKYNSSDEDDDMWEPLPVSAQAARSRSRPLVSSTNIPEKTNHACARDDGVPLTHEHLAGNDVEATLVDRHTTNITLQVYGHIKGMWAWGKGFMVVSPVLGLTECVVSTVAGVTTGNGDLEQLEHRVVEPLLSALDEHVLNPTVSSIGVFISDLLGSKAESTTSSVQQVRT